MEGKRLIKNKKIELAHVSNGYAQTEFYDYEPVSKFVFISKEKSIYSQKIKVELIISQDEILSAKCSCDDCDGYYYWMSNNKACKYKSAAKDLAIEYLKNNNTIDSTDAAGQQLINDFAGKARSQIISQSRQLDESLKIKPRIIMKDNELQIDFKVGSTKMFKISDLIHFVELVRSSESEKYGTNTMINHGIQNFTEESRRWVNFIQDSVDEEMRIREGVAESTWSSVKKKKMGCVPLYGWKIDQMYKLIDGNPVKYENRDIKKRTMITVKPKNPSIKIHIEPVIVDDVFQGIYVIIKSDQIFFGTETAYYIDADEGYLCRITDEYYKQMEPVLRQAKFGGAEFEIGRNNLQEFYYNVLPMLDEYADVTEKNSKQIEQYLLPETRFAFYLDAQDNDVDCKVTAKYGDKEYSCFDILKKRTSELEKCRVKIKEQEIMYRMENLFPVKDIEYETKIVKYEDKDMTQRLQKMVKPFILRRLKTDVLKDLPDKLEETRVVKFDGEQQKLYDAQVVHMKEEIAKNSEEDFNKNKLKILAELTRIRQICCDPHLCFENYNGQSAKLESCLELIDSAIEADHKILLFSQFTSMLKIIEERLLEKGIRFYKITGATSKKDRIGMVKQFNDDDTPVFLISLKAGGVGLNLTGADMVIHYDPWWNVAVQNQATDRAHRIGQTKKVTVYKMIAKGTIEEKIVKLQETKKDLADSIISGENIGISNLSKEDLMELLGI